jgi:MFS family permease
LYNLAWGAGLLGGPALGGFVFEHVGFQRLALLWAPPVALVTIVLAGLRSRTPKNSVHLQADGS